MKGEYLGEKQGHHHHTNPNNMFSKLQQQQQTQTFHHQAQPTFHNPFHIATTTTTAQNSEEADSLSPTTTSTTPNTTYNKESSLNNPSSHDGATIEVVRRPRGRPPGSKNKPKPPLIITREPEPSMSPYVLELPPNIDIVENVHCFCNKRNIGLCIFNGSGSVTNVTLHQPSSPPGATVTFHGRFDILSISATILPNANNNNGSNFTITLAGPQGQVFGGAVEGSLASAGTIFLIAATFNNPTYQRLPLLDDEGGNVEVSGGGNEGQRRHSPPDVSGGGGSGDGGGGGGGGDQMGMYGCNLASEVIWAPTARQPRNY
ncbi:hypothetical protein Leryth_006343 [Lithospermum erythrorhizon]|nr:hypothetical protein Leryth_006343 [Lithospermum erythrorhizon]